MADVLTGGTTHGLGRRRWVVVALVVALVLAGLYWVEHRRPGRATAPTPPHPAFGLYAQLGGRLLRADPGTGRTETVRGLPAGATTYLLPVRGGVLAATATRAYVIRGIRVVGSFPVSGPLVRDGSDRSVWVREGAGVRRLDLRGHGSGRVGLPPYGTLEQAGAHGLLVSTPDGRTRLLDTSGRVRARYGTFLAAGADRLLWLPTPPCCSEPTPSDFEPRISVLGSTDSRSIPLELVAEAGVAAISPDGFRVAVMAQTPTSTTTRAYLVDTRSGAITVVPGVTGGMSAGFLLGFSPDSRWLVASSPFQPSTWLWRIGSPRSWRRRAGYADFVAG